MELHQLRCFVAVAEELHFGRAARKLAMMPSALGRHVRLLEDDLGTRLLDRTTRHVSLLQAVQQIKRDRVEASIRSALVALRVYGASRPRLAVAALNPHGGENGNFGREELDEIGPAIEAVADEDADVIGPVPADSVFHQGVGGRYDGVLSQYHDQGHIASKTLDFDGTVSVTVGLPILRTSVDHGTAFDIAGTGKASHQTMLAAALAAADFAPFLDNIRATYG